MKSYFFIFILFLSSVFAVEIEVSAPLYINNDLISEIPIFIDLEHGVIKVNPLNLQPIVYEYLTQNGISYFDVFLQHLGYIPENIPKEDENFGIYFSTENQSVYLDVSLSLLRTRYTSVKRPSVFRDTKGAKTLYPKKISGYLNLEGGIRNRQDINIPFRPEGVSSFGNFNWNLHFKDTNLTGFGYFLAENTLGINPANLVLTKEFKQTGTKCSIGTINSTGISFQGTSPLIGMNISNNSQLITDPTIGSMSRHDLFLNAPSEVTIKVNGIYVNKLDLPAGSHTLQDFPLAQGLNNVTLSILGPTGEEREIDLSMFYNSTVMPVGKIQSNVTIGIPSFNIKKGPSGFYEFTPTIAFSGYLKGGLFDFFTLGGYFQAYDQSFFSGLQGIFVKSYFKTITELGLSYTVSNVPFFKTRIAILQPDSWKIPISWNLAFDAAEKGFRYFLGRDQEQNMAYLVSASIGTQPFRSVSLNMLGQYGYYRDEGNKYTIQGTLSFRPMRWCSIRGMLSYKESEKTPGKLETAINFDFTPKYKDFGTRTEYNTRQKALNSVITYNKSLPGRRSISGNFGYNNAPGANQVEGRVFYQGSHGIFRASQQLMKNSPRVISSTVGVTNVNVGTAFVFAGNKLAISRPIRESFVIISPNKYLRKTPVVVNPASNDFLSKASYYFPSVIPMQSYGKMNLSVVKEDGSYGGNFEDTAYHVKSLNKSGTVIEVGDAPTYIVEGILFDDGEEAEGITGMLISNFEENGKTLKFRFFTDEDGAFQILGAIPGRYTIKFTDKRFKRIENIEIFPEDKDLNYIYIGEYFIERKPKEKKYKELRIND